MAETRPTDTRSGASPGPRGAAGGTPAAEPKPAADAVAAQHRQLLASLPFSDTQDCVDARRGLIAALEPGIVHADGRVVWGNDSYAFLAGEAPDTVHPSPWRQSALNTIQGLFEVVPGIYQVRGLDLSNVTFIEGDRGVLVLDPLLSAEPGAAALGLYRRHRGERPLTGVIYTHSHADHVGGVRGVVQQEDVDAGDVPILAPEGFLSHAVGAGLGQTTSTGTFGVIPPTLDVTTTGQEETVDGVRLVFQMAPGSEAPAEMHVWFPQHRTLCVAEKATHVLHNILTIRGAQVRDARAWAGYLTEAIDLFGSELEVVFASHHWPTWGRERAVEFLALQRDLYAYLHHQTLRLLNQGLTVTEIAEVMVLPPALERSWHARGHHAIVTP